MNYFNNEGDLVEQLYGNKICTELPNYYEFWKKFIVRPELKNNIAKDVYNKLKNLHYSMFFSLASAHFHLDELKNNQRKTPQDRFRLLEFIESFYGHLGNAHNRLNNLWDVIKQISNYSNPNLLKYLKARDTSLFHEKEAFYNEVVELRNNIVHGGQMLVHLDDSSGKLYLPDPKYINEKNRDSWEELQKVQRLDKDILKRAEYDLARMEQLINKIQKLAMEEIEKFLKSKGIDLNSSTTQTPQPQHTPQILTSNVVGYPNSTLSVSACPDLDKKHRVYSTLNNSLISGGVPIEENHKKKKK